MTQVTVVTGPPGAGKSTVARLLAERLTPGVHLHTDDFWHYIRSGHVAPYLPAAHRQNEVVMAAIAEAASGYARGGYHVFCDGIVGPWFIDVFRAVARRDSIPLSYVVLRPDEETTLARAMARGDGALVDPGPIRDLYRQFADLGEYERFVVDTTGMTAAETADGIEGRLAQGAHVLA